MYRAGWNRLYTVWKKVLGLINRSNHPRDRLVIGPRNNHTLIR